MNPPKKQNVHFPHENFVVPKKEKSDAAKFISLERERERERERD
jgi:hypothetical protein